MDQVDKWLEHYGIDAPEVRDWLHMVSKHGYGSINTKRTYIKNLGTLAKELGLSPAEMLKAAREDLPSFERKLAAWWDSENGHSRTNKYLKQIALKSFLVYNDITLSKKSDVKRPRAKKRAVVTKEDLKKLLDCCSLKARAYLLVARDCGLSPDDLLNLKYGDIRREFEAGTAPIMMNLVRGKTEVPFTTFLGKESIEALRTWIEFRKRPARVHGKKIKGETFTDKTPLFEKYQHRQGQMSYSSIRDQIDRAAEKAGLDFKPNDMRKYFSTNLRTEGINEALIKLWQGHSIGVEEGYVIPSEKKQSEIYEEHYGALSLQEEGARKEDIERLEGERETMRRMLDEQQRQIQDLQKIIRGDLYLGKKIQGKPVSGYVDLPRSEISQRPAKKAGRTRPQKGTRAPSGDPPLGCG